MTYRIWPFLVGLSAVSMIAASVFFYLSTQVKTDPLDSGIKTIQKIQQIDSSWNVEITRVRSNPNSDFDGLNEYAFQIAQQKNQLNDLLITSDVIPERLAASTASFISSMNAKEEQVERFKSGFAILRNSERYLPLAANKVIEASRSASQGEVVSETLSIVENLNSFIQSPRNSEKERIGLMLDGLGNRIDGFSQDVATSVSEFLSHARVLLETTGDTRRYYDDATSSSTMEVANQLIAGFNAVASQVTSKKTQLQYAAVGGLAFVGMLGMFGSVAGRGRADTEPAVRKYSSATLSGDEEETGSQPDAIDAIAFKTFAGMVSEQLIPSYNLIKTNLQGLNELAGESQESIKKIRSVIYKVERGALRNDQALSEIHQVIENFPSPEADAVSNKENDDMQSVSRLGQTIWQLSEFAGRGESATLEWVSMDDIILEVSRPYREDKNLSFDIKLGDVPHVLAQKDDLAFMIECMLERSYKSLMSSEQSDPRMLVSTRSDNGQVLVTITENGKGFLEEDKKNITRMFKPGKESELDLELPSVFYIARKYGGKFLVSSAEQQGSAIRVQLPISKHGNA